MVIRKGIKSLALVARSSQFTFQKETGSRIFPKVKVTTAGE